ncbi:MAG: polysaccharide deacetylase family protein, partial [Deltaproteobacteria bacterium]
HELACHSYSHPYFSMFSARAAEREITGAHKIIQHVVQEAGVGVSRQNRFFRFPYGDAGSYLNYDTSQEVLADLGYQIAWWDLDTQDWRMELSPYARKPAAVIASLSRARARDVVLLHDRTRTAQVLPSLLDILHSKGMASLPLSEYPVSHPDKSIE